MDLIVETLRENLEQVTNRVEAAADRAGRSAETVRLVCVTKTVDRYIAECLLKLGASDLGENRPQELWCKAGEITVPVKWHMIGHLQRNKARRTLSLASYIHSIDSTSLMRRIEDLARELELQPKVLLEVNVSGEETKHGFRLQEMPMVMEEIQKLSHVQVQGLMTMAPFGPDPEHARPTFAALRELRECLNDGPSASHRLSELSMGMSRDFEVAIEEGATMVRVGTALFEGLRVI